MVRFNILIIILFNIMSAQVIQKFTDPLSCKSCHESQYKEWSGSLHSNSHEHSNELYKNVLRTVENELNLSHEEAIIKCGKCHNPRLDVKNIDDNTIIAKAFGVSTENSQKLDIAVDAKHIKNGISCYICHNVDNISKRKSNEECGYQILNWIKDDTIVGPYSDLNNRAVFHKSEQRDFFLQGDELCLVCHQGAIANMTFTSYTIGDEIGSVVSEKRCVDCHMGKIKEDIISPNVRPEIAIKRKIRPHIFTGSRNSDILTTSIDFMVVKTSEENAKFTIKNLIPHNLPSGFSGRSLVIEISIMQNDVVLHKQDIDMRSVYTNSLNQETFSYSAKNFVSDTRLKPLETREFDIEIPTNATSINISVFYYILAPQLQYKFEFKDPIYTKKYLVATKKFEL